MKVVNRCRINFKYRLSNESYIVSKTIFSNIVSTQVIENTLKIRKNVNKMEVTFFDILIYKIDILNISSIDVMNIFLQDNIPNGIRFIQNSVKINDVKKRCANPQNGFPIGSLKSGEKVTITFKLVIVPICLKNSINNYSTIEYDYLYNVEKAPIRVRKNSNIVNTKCENKLFKQISIGNILKIQYRINKIIDAKCSTKIIKTKIINIVRDNLCTLLVIGKIQYKIWYITEYNIKCFEDIVGFSSCMAVPIGINYDYGYKDEVKIDVECLSTNLIDKNTVFINMNLLLHY